VQNLVVPTPAPNTAALVGGILGGLLGFVLLLGLLILLLCCCCGWGRYGGAAAGGGVLTAANIENTHIAAKSSTLIYPVPFHSISAACLDKLGHYGGHIEVPALNIASDRCYYDPNINTMRSVASARSTTRPEHYLNILTVHRDVDDCAADGISVRSMRDNDGCSMPYEIPIINQAAEQQQQQQQQQQTTTTTRRYVLSSDNDHPHQGIRNHNDYNRCDNNNNSMSNNNNNNNDYYVHSYQQQYDYNQPRYI
jgi:hypothetical protein